METGDSYPRGAPQDVDIRGNVLQLEEEIGRPGCLRTPEAEEPGGGERTIEGTGRRPKFGQTDPAGRAEKVLRPSRKRGMVDNIRMEYNIIIQRCCKLILLHKSVCYSRAKGRSDELLRMRMNEIAAVRVRYGFWHILLRRKSFMDNHKRMYRDFCEEGLNLRSKWPKRNRSAAHRQPAEGNVSSLNECWSMDFVSDQLYNGNRFRALTLVDNSRECWAIYTGKSLKGSDVVHWGPLNIFKV